MANSSIIEDIKDRVVKDIIQDDLIIKVIDADVEYADDIIEKNLFTYNKNPITIQDSITFLTVQVHIPQSYSNKKWVRPILEIWIISHNKHMAITNIPKIKSNRNDYLSQLLDEKFNGRKDLGFGTMMLETNVEGIHPDNNNFVYRRLLFETKDLNNSMCYDE